MGDKDNAAFLAGLRRLAENLAAKDPALEDMRSVAKILVSELRKQIVVGQAAACLGAYLDESGTVSFVQPKAFESAQQHDDLLLRLRDLAKNRNLRAAALGRVVKRRLPVPGATSIDFIEVHMEHREGKALMSAVPADERELTRPIPGVKGPALGLFGGRAQPKIFQKASLP